MAHGMLKADVRLPSDAESKTRVGKVEVLDNAVPNGTGTINLRATLPNSDHHYWPGQFVDVKLVLSTQRGAVLIPTVEFYRAAPETLQEFPEAFLGHDNWPAQVGERDPSEA
jgi:membrane fusion protein, multidrug efflux system